MMQKKYFLLVFGSLLAFVGGLIPAAVQAQFLKSGSIRVYASAVVSDQISDASANEYGITQSASRVLLHVIVRDGEPGLDKAIEADIDAIATRKDRSTISINMQRTVSEKDVFYLGDVSINKNEALNFEITIQLPNQEPMRMTFYQEFFNP